MDMNKIPKIVALLFSVSLLPVLGCRPTEYEYVIDPNTAAVLHMQTESVYD